MIQNTEIDVTIVEEDLDQQRLFARVLSRAGFRVAVADNMRDGIERINIDMPRVVLCSNELPDGNGVELFRNLHKSPELVGTYCILLSATACSDLAAHALEAWADDYILKPVMLQELAARVRVGIRMWTMHNQLRKAAITDGLTGLYNHDHFHRVLEAEMGRSRRYGSPMALIMLDLDYFKAINDTYGHLTGNSVLEEVARVLRDQVRDVDTVGRVGGEEFAAILPEARAADAVVVAERIRAALPKSLSIEAIHQHEVTASFGIVDSENPGAISAANLVDLADRALYVAKRGGRNRIALASDLNERNETDTMIETDEVEWLRQRLAVLSTRVRDVYVQSVATLLKALDEKDSYSARHSVNVAFYARRIAEAMNCSRSTCTSVYNAALLHDIGKVAVPESILSKRTPLTPLEHMTLNQVPLIGTRIIDHMRILESEIQIIRHQREHFDGSGVPTGLCGEQIPIGSRVLLVADAFDAMTTDRVYRTRRHVDDVLAEIQRLAGTQFDPAAVSALDRVLTQERPQWLQRICDTIKASRQPSDEGLALAADGFVPGAI